MTAYIGPGAGFNIIVSIVGICALAGLIVYWVVRRWRE